MNDAKDGRATEEGKSIQPRGNEIIRPLTILTLCLFFISISVLAFADEVRTSTRVIKYADFYYTFGQDYRASGKYQEAIDAYKQAIKIKPDYADAYYNLGNAYVNSGEYQEAIDAYKQVNRIMPYFADAYFSLSLVYVNLNKYQDAVYALKLAIKIKSDSAETYPSRGHSY